MITVKILIDGVEREAYISDAEIRKSWCIISEKANDIIPQRKCKLKGYNTVAKFINWEHYSMPLEASPLEGGAPAGVFSRIYAIVELEDGRVMRTEAENIIFI